MHFHLPQPLHGWRAFVGEVGIIVLGVLIALGAEQMVEEVHDRHKQHETLERLFEESRVDVAELRERQPDAKTLARETAFATALTKQNICPPAQQWSALDTVTHIPQVTVRTSVYDEVVGAGGLADIASTRARDAVAEFHSALTWVDGQTDFFRSLLYRPVPIDDPRLTVVFDPAREDPQIRSYDREALCRDGGFRNRVANSVRNHLVWDGFRQEATDAAIRMCAVLGHELGKQCTPAEGPAFTAAERRIAAETLVAR